MSGLRPTKATNAGSTKTLAASAPLRSRMVNAVLNRRRQVPLLQSGAFWKRSRFVPAPNVANDPGIASKTERKAEPETARNAPSRTLAVLPFVSERSDPPMILSTLPLATLKTGPFDTVS